ncbi:MAG: outer membrane beta-barrel protein [Bacteroidota bacterium]
MKSIAYILVAILYMSALNVSATDQDEPGEPKTHAKHSKKPFRKTVSYNKEMPRHGDNNTENTFHHANAVSTGPVNNRFQLNIGLDAGFPVGKYSQDPYNYKAGFGGNIMLLYYVPTWDKVAITGSIGVDHFGSSSYTSVNGNTRYTSSSGLDIMPIQLGVRYHFSDIFYGSFEFGFVNRWNTYKVNEVEHTNSKGYFGLSPALGVALPAGGVLIDLSARYQYVATEDPFNFIGIRAAVGLPFGKP